MTVVLRHDYPSFLEVEIEPNVNSPPPNPCADVTISAEVTRTFMPALSASAFPSVDHVRSSSIQQCSELGDSASRLNWRANVEESAMTVMIAVQFALTLDISRDPGSDPKPRGPIFQNKALRCYG
jgi:hypothetical protein